ncbi:MAG: DUF2442 domain-containing protein [Nitrospira sp.]|nr:DUF2442 domain-containing protein [Nitrospira sp.]
MKSIIHSKDMTGIEVTNITKHGLWLLTRDHELFISFKEFPQFQDASVSKIMKIEQPNPNVLHWPDLGIELAVESVRCFPLVSKQSFSTPRSGRQAKTRTDLTIGQRSASSPHRNVTQKTEHEISEDSARC